MPPLRLVGLFGMMRQDSPVAGSQGRVSAAHALVHKSSQVKKARKRRQRTMVWELLRRDTGYGFRDTGRQRRRRCCSMEPWEVENQ